jgi:hypothetical protein
MIGPIEIAVGNAKAKVSRQSSKLQMACPKFDADVDDTACFHNGIGGLGADSRTSRNSFLSNGSISLIWLNRHNTYLDIINLSHLSCSKHQKWTRLEIHVLACMAKQ